MQTLKEPKLKKITDVMDAVVDVVKKSGLIFERDDRAVYLWMTDKQRRTAREQREPGSTFLRSLAKIVVYPRSHWSKDTKHAAKVQVYPGASVRHYGGRNPPGMRTTTFKPRVDGSFNYESIVKAAFTLTNNAHAQKSAAEERDKRDENNRRTEKRELAPLERDFKELFERHPTRHFVPASLNRYTRKDGSSYYSVSLHIDLPTADAALPVLEFLKRLREEHGPGQE